ncbi:hypothetical protein [uncultured Shewanella sp.]|uniref:hypothetical protein n=1 Tax=uncultured Shewanella sp. TaxID=173975 RepID=UPI002629B9EA|nr:hypothetical protein [uncultured Shewanella sp.]
MSDGEEKENATELIQANINQSIASAVESATDLLRNISTIETTVIGVASAKWLAEPANVAYKEIIENATQNIAFAVENLANVGAAGASVLSDLKPK